MHRDPSDPSTARQRLRIEIKQALQTCDAIGDRLTACHLQMALDRCSNDPSPEIVRLNGDLR